MDVQPFIAHSDAKPMSIISTAPGNWSMQSCPRPQSFPCAMVPYLFPPTLLQSSILPKPQIPPIPIQVVRTTKVLKGWQWAPTGSTFMSCCKAPLNKMAAQTHRLEKIRDSYNGTSRARNGLASGSSFYRSTRIVARKSALKKSRPRAKSITWPTHAFWCWLETQIVDMDNPTLHRFTVM